MNISGTINAGSQPQKVKLNEVIVTQPQPLKIDPLRQFGSPWGGLSWLGPLQCIINSRAGTEQTKVGKGSSLRFWFLNGPSGGGSADWLGLKRQGCKAHKVTRQVALKIPKVGGYLGTQSDLNALLMGWNYILSELELLQLPLLFIPIPFPLLFVVSRGGHEYAWICAFDVLTIKKANPKRGTFILI